MLDLNKNGFVSLDEFVEGTLKMKGEAKSKDLMALQYDVHKLLLLLKKLLQGTAYLNQALNPQFGFVRPLSSPMSPRSGGSPEPSPSGGGAVSGKQHPPKMSASPSSPRPLPPLSAPPPPLTVSPAPPKAPPPGMPQDPAQQHTGMAPQPPA